MKKIYLIFCIVIIGFQVEAQLGRFPFHTSKAAADVAVKTYEDVLDDGNTYAWFMIGDGSSTYLTKDAEDSVSVWKNLKGTSGNLTATKTAMPLYSSDGILFNGTSSNLYNNGADYNQPESIYLVFRQVTWTIYNYILTGNLYNKGTIQQEGTTPQIRVTSDYSNFSSRLSLTIGNFAVVRILFNGASSKFMINADSTSGNYGSADMDGIRIGAGSASAGFSNVEFKEAIFRKVADTYQDRNLIYNYLKDKYGLDMWFMIILLPVMFRKYRRRFFDSIRNAA